VQDIDKNIHLDFCGTENLPLGHNNTGLTKVSHYAQSLTVTSWSTAKSGTTTLLTQTSTAATRPAQIFAQLAAKTLQSIRPADHLQGVTLTDSRNATEQALLDAFS